MPARALLALLACALLSLAACSASDTTSGEDGAASSPQGEPELIAHVELYNNAFRPDAVTISPGGKVVWRNRDKVDYNVALSGSFEETLVPGMLYEHTFMDTGTYTITAPENVSNPIMTVHVVDPDDAPAAAP